MAFSLPSPFHALRILPKESFNFLHLLLLIFNLGYWPEGMFGNHRQMGVFWHGEKVILDFRGQAQEAHDLGDPGA